MSPSSPLDYAKLGDVEYFKTVELNVLRNFKGENGDGILALTAYIGQLDCCKEIYQRCPEQLFCQNRHGNSILHHVAHHCGGMLNMLEFFLDVDVKAKEDIESGVREDNIQFKEWCKLQNQDGETAFLRTIQVRNLKAARLWLKVDNDHKLQLLSIANYEGNTPLHLAVGYQELEMVKLLIQDELDFEYGANRNGATPFLLAIQKDKSRTTFVNDTTVRIRQLILESQPDQTKVRTGENGWTLLHYATYNGDLGAVEDIIRFCPDCMDMVDSEGQNFVHIAAKFEQTKLVKYILSKKKLSDQVLNCKDNDGNTPFHIAVLTGNEPLTRCFLFHGKVDKDTVNNDFQHVLHEINFGYDKRKAGCHTIIDQGDLVDQSDLVNQSNVGLVVGTLIATVSFTAGITVPGGYISEGPNLGMAMLSKSASFEAFVISNNFALMLSLYAVINDFSVDYLRDEASIIRSLKWTRVCISGALLSMVVAFAMGSYAVLAISNRIAITICVISSCFLVLMIQSLWVTWYVASRDHLVFIKRWVFDHIQACIWALAS